MRIKTTNIKSSITQLVQEHDLPDTALKDLIETDDPAVQETLSAEARKTATRIYGNEIYPRGLIEFTSYCQNDCYYCGLRKSNVHAERYRLTRKEILECCRTGYDLGFRTFVLQGGDDPAFSDDIICRIVTEIRNRFPDCAITLSIGEKTRESYLRYFHAGANRYLLRHETADPAHYRQLHPGAMRLEHRKQCLFDLKEIGYQTGCGIMVGSPGQTTECLIEDLRFMQQLQPHMIGIGPFIACEHTPFAHKPDGTLEQTLRMLSILRLMFPDVLLPATTALGTISPTGREQGILAGANVVMPNLSPVGVRKKYQLYNGKICTGEEAAECRGCLQGRMEIIGYRLVMSRGDHPSLHRQCQRKENDG